MGLWRRPSIVPYLRRSVPTQLIQPVVGHYLFPALTRRKLTLATQVAGVVVTPNSDGITANVQIGPNGFTQTIAHWFDRSTFDPAHLINNLRLKNVVGNFGQSLFSQEFADAVNAAGVHTTAGDFYALSFAFNADGSVTISFGTEIGGAANSTITVENPGDLYTDTGDITLVLKNIGALLRYRNFHDLTTPATSGAFVGKTAIQVINATTFVY